MFDSKREYNLTTIEALSRTTEKALDDALVQDACAGDNAAFEQIFARHGGKLDTNGGN